MTATESSKNRSFFGTRLKNNFTAHKKLLIVNIVMSVLGLPVLAVIAIIIAYFDNIPYEEMTEQMRVLEDQVTVGCIPFMMLSVVTIGISIFLGMIIALMHFSYLYRKTVTDMNYALPLTGTQRFFADYLSGLIIYMVPIICAVIFFFTAMGIATPFLERGLDGYWDAFPQLLQISGIALTAILLFYTLSVLAITFCGNTFEAIFSIIAFNALIPSTVGCVWLALCSGTSYGIVSEAILYSNTLTSTSPIGAIFFVFQFLDTVDSSSSYYNSVFFKWLFITFVVIAIYLVGAYLIYRFRKSEDVSKPYVHKAAFYAIMTMAVYCVLSIFISLGAFLVAGIVICAVGWFIMEVITRRGFKKFWQAGVGFVLCVISVIAVCKICEATDGFGMAKSVPSSLTVESVIIDDVTYKNKDVIKKTIELHQELVDRHFHPNNYEYTPAEAGDGIIAYDDYLEITYKTVTGRTIMREYRVPTGMESELTKAMVLSDEYAKSVSDNLYYYWFRYSSDDYRYPATILDKFGHEKNISINKEDAKRFCNAYSDDLKAMTLEDLENFDAIFYMDSYMNNIWILSSFTNTLNFLHEYHVDFEEVTEERLTSLDVVGIYEPVFLTRSKVLFEEKEERYGYYDYYYYDTANEFFIMDSICTLRSGISNDKSNARKLHSSEKLAKVLNNCTPDVIEGKPIAVFYVKEDYNYVSSILYLNDTPENRRLLEDLNKSQILIVGGGSSQNGWD